MIQQEFYSNGKLLLTGEYAVLNGAEAWAMPTKFGQSLKIQPKNRQNIVWRSLDENDKLWFECELKIDSLRLLSTSDEKIAKSVVTLLKQAQKLSGQFLANAKGFEVEAKLTFPKDWGLGSSSTLINNIAQWADVDAFKLSAATFGGSGYDIACARHDKHILYKLEQGFPTVMEINKFDQNLHPLASNIFFIHLNKKQNSRQAIENYQNRKIDTMKLAIELSRISRFMIDADDLDYFESQIQRHEKIVSDALGIPSVKERLFSDYFGAVKSLGAWGGDFIMATGTNEKTPEYFKSKGFDTVLSFEEMVLQ